MRNTVVSIALCLGLVACGGGGSSDGGTAPVITSTNYVTVAREALASTSYVITSGDLLKSSAGTTGVHIGGVALGVKFLRARLPELAGWIGAVPPQATGATQTNRVNCDSGWMDVTVNDANGNGVPDAGDSFSMLMSNCRYGGDTLNGTMGLTINSVTGDLNSNVYTMAASMSFDNLRSVSATTSTAGSGNLAMTVASRGVNDATTTITLPNFTMTSTYANVPQSVVLTNMTVAEVVTPLGEGYRSSLTVNGSFSSSSFNNHTLTVATVNPFVQVNGQDYPSSGQIIISDSTSRKVRVTVLNSTSLTIEVDASGSGNYELLVTKLWSEMI